MFVLLYVSSLNYRHWYIFLLTKLNDISNCGGKLLPWFIKKHLVNRLVVILQSFAVLVVSSFIIDLVRLIMGRGVCPLHAGCLKCCGIDLYWLYVSVTSLWQHNLKCSLNWLFYHAWVSVCEFVWVCVCLCLCLCVCVFFGGEIPPSAVQTPSIALAWLSTFF